MSRRIPWIPVVMVGLFVAAVVYVNPLDAGRELPPRPAADHAEHSGVPDGGDGLSDNHDGYALSPVVLPDRRGDRLPLAFRLVNPDGAPAVPHEPVQSEPLHLYVLREDLSFYQHLHPTRTGDTWTAAVDVPDGGVYRLYAEFVPKERAGGVPIVLGTPFVIAGDTRYVPLPAPAPTVRVGGFTVSRLEGTADLAAGRPGTMRFQVSDARGAPVTALEPYLGVYGHASVFESMTQRLTHLHPTVPADTRATSRDGVLTFHTQLPQRGRHRVFLQFKVMGEVHQAAFTVIAT
ncbi:hypothetical protein [Phytohabitans houttuyneae]|uniref:Secreted protein n=1 Tax=Phytohabitans houttuyneae TaxID=1076126 RepID=A0A6V8KGK9_9ACTN|nr:hypothetical protein [Phytohabitans houttuyneae]GFJ80827.1 hypothetical protein Phou_050070 [Phytohabitans houttuyneae]